MNWMQTYTGLQFDLLNPKILDINIEDIAHALALQTRFGGHCLKFYSVAQHSVIVSKLTPKEFSLWGLLHDATEAYLSDVISPIKNLLPTFVNIEDKLMKSICIAFNLSWPKPIHVSLADKIALKTEFRDLMNNKTLTWTKLEHISTIEEKIIPLQWEEAEQLFLKRYYELQNLTQC